jgi:RimJ/RimL family protein N-acetyltransferase
MNAFGQLITRLSRRGFVGPRFDGIAGKLRFAYQQLVGHHEIVLMAEPRTFLPEHEASPELELRFIQAWANFDQYRAQFDSAYYPGYVDSWREVFDWKQELAILLVGGLVAGFGWIQRGASSGVSCHYGQLREGEYRILRVGVLPPYRRRGVNTSFYTLLVRALFSRGASRVMVDCSRDNAPSLRAQVKAGFRPIGELYVRGRLRRRAEAQWTAEYDSAMVQQFRNGAE